jgi:hypothetical protein
MSSRRRLVLEKWRKEWYMGRIVSSKDEDPVDTLRIHVWGDNEEAEKLFPLRSTSIIHLEYTSKEKAIQDMPVGYFPLKGDLVQLTISDQAIAPLLIKKNLKLVGRVSKVYPHRDASMIQVIYPADKEEERIWHIGNGYVSN